MENFFNALELRILGSLIEKELTTPDYYPLTLNALKSACNQKSNRNPVIKTTEDEIVEILYEMQLKKLVRKQSLVNSRTPRYMQLIDEKYNLDTPQKAILAELFLRGPQTPGELRGRADRMHPFDSITQVEAILDEFMQRDPPYLKKLERRPGQKENRYMHLFADPDQEDIYDIEPAHEDPVGAPVEIIRALEERVSVLEEEVRILKEELERIKNND